MEPNDVRRGWAERTGDYSPAYYAAEGPNETSEWLSTVLEYYEGHDAAILEVGCSSGRHLAHLRNEGFEDLTGIDINDESFDVMAAHYPELAATGEFRTGAVEEILPEFADDRFDAVVSVETLQHIHPDDAWVFDEVVRIAAGTVATVENEGNGARRGRDGAQVSYVNDDFPLFHRNWRDVFSERGLVQVVHEPSERDTHRAFRVLD